MTPHPPQCPQNAPQAQQRGNMHPTSPGPPQAILDRQEVWS